MEKYVKVSKIGQGSFGCAYLATRKASVAESNELRAKQQFVIKEVRLDPRDQESAQREARLLAALDHPNIIACKESFLLKPSPSNAALLGRHLQRPTILCIVTEFADGGDLSQELERRGRSRRLFEPDELLGLFVQVCLALKHLHDRKILHRDVKPANIFLTESGVVKLGDLGVATVLSHTLACAQTSIGTPYYTAPEICLGKRYNAKADVWSLGCVLFEMATFTHAFEGRSQRQLFDNIVQGGTPQLPARGSPSSIRQELQALVDDMLRKEPRARPSVNQLIRRPLVLARIQSFLSARALASELNHTVLHGENVFRKKPSTEEKALPIAPPPAPQSVRRAELVSPAVKAVIKSSPRQPQKLRKTPPHARNAKARVGSLLGASRKGRGLPQGALRRSRPIQKPSRVPARASAVRNQNVAKRAVPTNAKRQGAVASAEVKARLKAQLKANEAAVAALPDPPTIQKTKIQVEATRAGGKPQGVADRVAAFNAKWAAQREQLVKNLPPPPPSTAKAIARKTEVCKKSKQAVRGYPSPIVIGLNGRVPQASKQAPPPPAPVNIRRQQTKQKAPVSRDLQPSLRERRLEFQQKKEAGQGGAPRTRKASPLDDPIILVQQLPTFKTPPATPTHETPEQVTAPPSTLTCSFPDFADKEAGDAELTTDSAQTEEGEDHELTSLPSMKNLEFERMVLQLKSVVESDMVSSDDENDENDENDDVFDPTRPPPPYSPPSATVALETLNVSMLQDPVFRLALHKRLQNLKVNPEQVNEHELVLEPAQQELLAWMQNYISSLL